jgi:hypothetical protein
MDVKKFEDIVNNDRLFFCRPDKFQDPFEGSLTSKDQKKREKYYKEELPKTASATADQMHLRESIAINCWHRSESESEQMWKLYFKGTQGVAIKTDLKSLRACFRDPRTIFFARVKYIDYDSAQFSSRLEGGMTETWVFSSFVHKRVAFQHERELRAMIIFSTRNIPNLSGTGFVNNGDSVSVEPDVLIKEIRLHPACSDKFKRKVEQLCSGRPFASQINRSDLIKDPLF